MPKDPIISERKTNRGEKRTPIENDTKMWCDRGKVKPLERGNTMPKKEYEMLERLLKQVGESLQAEFEPFPSFYLVAVCPDPNCRGILGQMFRPSANLICYNCGREYELKEWKPEEHATLKKPKNKR